MESVVSFITALNSLSPLAIIGLLGLVIFLLVKNTQLTVTGSEAVSSLKTNDLHELPEMVLDIRKVAETLQRIEVAQAENFSWLRAKLNGGSDVKRP